MKSKRYFCYNNSLWKLSKCDGATDHNGTHRGVGCRRAVVRWRHNASGYFLRFPRIVQDRLEVYARMQECVFESGGIVIYILRPRLFLFICRTKIIAPGSNNLLHVPPRAWRYKIKRKEITRYLFEYGEWRRRRERQKKEKRKKTNKRKK